MNPTMLCRVHDWFRRSTSSVSPRLKPPDSIAALSLGVGARTGLAIARVLTIIATVMNVSLIAILLRRYGRCASLCGALLFAIFPLAVTATNSLTLEPYFVFFSLIGSTLLFGNDRYRRSRVIASGVAVGIAVDIKLWALVPAIVLIVVALISDRRRGRVAGLSALCALVVLLGPFLVIAPGNFVHDVFGTQFARATARQPGPSVSSRIVDLTGVRSFVGHGGSSTIAWVLAAVICALIVCVATLTRRRLGAFEAFAFVSWVGLTCAVIVTNEFYDYYSYAPAAFGCLTIGCALGLIRGSAGVNQGSSVHLRHFAVPVVIVAFCFVAIPRGVGYAREFMAASGPFDPSAAIDAVIPAGACVLSDQMSLIVDADRVTPASSGCPAVVDPYGSWLAADSANPPPSSGPYSAALVSEWSEWLDHARYLLLEFPIPQSRVIPASPGVVKQFTEDFQLRYSSYGANVYERRSPNPQP